MKNKNWEEKMKDSKDLPKVVKLAPNGQKHWHGETMVVPAPLEVDEIMRSVPEGKLITINEIRQMVAKKHKTDIGCPLTCGIFAWIVANAAEEMREKEEISDEDITPWWRTLKSGGVLNEKFPSGPDMQKKLLEAEGHKVVQKGKKWMVEDYEKKVVKV
ncbi:MGMT family protein [candidate division WS5 bacterium]|uniref:MGMT family protein n=1 Tax=candidate division WS5 bacterium TaxID=2093353 RepID=A0A419DEG9_9BACT|nr:MAG: MGMT family protein [candidate division WS5 bacterium]